MKRQALFFGIVTAVLGVALIAAFESRATRAQGYWPISTCMPARAPWSIGASKQITPAGTPQLQCRRLR